MNNIDQIQDKMLQGFDFGMVHRVMTAIEWEWAQHDGRRVPTIDELQAFALLLVKDAIEETEKTKQPASLRCGGFSVVASSATDVSLEFILENCKAVIL